MTTDHEEVQELLAAHAVWALEVEENRQAERLIASHVPDCQECREALKGFTAVSSELALAAGGRRPPRVIATRLRRQIKSSRQRRRAWALLSAAALLSLIALAGWSAHLSTRVNDADVRQARTGEFLATVSHPLSHVVPLSSTRSTSPGAALAQLAAAYVPGSGSLYLFGSLPAPRQDRVYQLWVLRDGRFQSAGTFRPERGQVLYRIKADVERIQELLVTEEPMAGSSSPSDQRVVTASL